VESPVAEGNRIKLLRQSGKRSRIPDILTPREISNLWHRSAKRERAMMSIEPACKIFPLGSSAVM